MLGTAAGLIALVEGVSLASTAVAEFGTGGDRATSGAGSAAVTGNSGAGRVIEAGMV